MIDRLKAETTYLKDQQRDKEREVQLCSFCTQQDIYSTVEYLTIIPRAQMDYESIGHEAEGLMGY